MKDNCFQNGALIFTVVNCFQKLLSSWWRTTFKFSIKSRSELWIAFKNYYLRDEGQPNNSNSFFLKCCELLSKIIIFVMKDNFYNSVLLMWHVVNCFQKLLSSWWRTTDLVLHDKCNTLWIAFKNYYLRDEGQLITFNIMQSDSCELLSKIIIFVMKDNVD